MCIPCSNLQAYRCGSVGQLLTRFSLEYSDRPPNAFQKSSGSEPSLTSRDCLNGCINNASIVQKRIYYIIFNIHHNEKNIKDLLIVFSLQTTCSSSCQAYYGRLAKRGFLTR